MEKIKKIGKKLLFPHAAIIILLFIASAAALAVAFLVLPDNEIVNYSSYVLSAYTLTVICFRIPAIVKWVQRFIENNKLASQLKNDAHMRIKVSLSGSMIFNAFYALFNSDSEYIIIRYGFTRSRVITFSSPFFACLCSTTP